MEIISKVKPYWNFNFFKKFISVLVISLKTYTVDAWWEKMQAKMCNDLISRVVLMVTDKYTLFFHLIWKS